MLAHITSRNPDLVRRMRRLWSLLDLNDIELQARYIRSEANEWADRLSRDTDIDDWKLNRRWLDWAQTEWGECTVDRFASEISAQLLRYYAHRWDPHREGVGALAYNWGGENNGINTARGENGWINPPWGLLDEVAHKLREEGAGGTVVAPYWPGQSWFREPEAIADEAGIASAASQPVLAKGARLEVYWPLDDDWCGGTVTKVSDTGQHHIQYEYGDEKWRLLSEELTCPEQQQVTEENDDVASGHRRGRALARGYYGPKAKNFKDFCDGEGREWLSASEETVHLYLAALRQKGGIQATSMQPYLSAINNYHEDMGLPGLAKGRSVTRAVKGMARLRVAASEATGVTVTERTWLPAKHVRTENVLLGEEGVTVVLTREKDRSHKLKKRQLSIPCFWRLPGDRVYSPESDTDLGNKWLQRALGSVGCVPPEGGHFSAHSARKGATTCARRAVGVVMEKVCFLGGWAQLSTTYFGWLAPPSVRTQGC
ncbi:hypothetical protein CYMTET_14377 [Cymbomonas tetramitiformis]|uniref:Integrase n=1 Tax=Cymbomonas tetramitiformis TaxID=36881 RepID=A0AAE0GGG6_9CHLO|nr:hypothetical protein CYMTET_14377 [Cymbomonas tetramitiformis]